jgi:hypothetical protein
VLKQIDPSEFAKVINEANIVFIIANRVTCGSPYNRENKI